MTNNRRVPKSKANRSEKVPRRARSHQRLTATALAQALELHRASTANEVFANALYVATTLLGLDTCQIAVFAPDARSCTIHSLDEDGELHRESSPTNVGLVALARADGAVRMDAAMLRRHAEPRFDKAVLSESVQSAILLPLHHAGQGLAGVFVGAARSKGLGNSENLPILQLFAFTISAALELTHARHDLRHWNAIVESSDAAILAKDKNGIITHWNPAAERLYGYTAEEVIGHSVTAIVPPDKSGEWLEMMARVGQGTSVEQLETVRVTKSGSRIHVSLTMSAIKNSAGEVVGASTIARDITTQRHERERFRQAVDSAPNAMLLVNGDGHIILANVEATRLFGYSHEELVGSGVELLLPSEHRAQHQEQRRQYLNEPTKRPMGQGRELWALGKDGRRIPVEVALNPIDGDGDVNVLASVVDISERHRVASERERLLLEAQRNLRERDQFLSVASHELKTPLATLRLTATSLQRQVNEVENSHAPRLQRKVEVVQRQVERLDKLVEQLLDLSRMTAGRFSLERARVDLRQIAKEVVERFVQSDEPSAGAIRFEARAPVHGAWDPSRVDQVLTNLVANALQYGEGQPVLVSVTDRGAEVDVTVRDHGRGIAPEDQQRIFERFERVASDTSRNSFGLGLWIAKEIVAAHGGRISVESQPRQGATFTVSLPKTAS